MDEFRAIDDLILKWKWKYGRPVEILAEFQVDLFRTVIKDMKLKPLDIEIDVPRNMVDRDMQFKSLETKRAYEEIPAVFRRIKFPGGIIGPHFHFEGRIYLLDDKQWKKFTTEMMHVFQERLSAAETINVEQFAKMNEVLTTF
jgi:hypothetical protein